MSGDVTYFAESDFRNRGIRFGIKRPDRARHMYVIGKTGTGKSTLLENLAVQDIARGEGICFIDPHGSSAEKLLGYIPQERIKDVLYFAPFDTDYPVAFNVMEDVGPDKRHLVANGLMSAFKKIWVDAWSARMEYILNNIILALLEYPDATLLGVNRMLADKDYRNAVVANIKDPSVRSFWVDEFAKYGDRYMQEAGAAIQNKVGQFISNPLVRNIIGQPKSTFDLRRMMDERKIVIVNLSKGRVGEQNANLLGSMMITKMYLAAMSRADAGEDKIKNLPPSYFYVDEFQTFANKSFADILSEARKYNLNLIIANQYIEQMDEEVRPAVFGNVGTTIVFRVGPFDAEVLEKIFDPYFTAIDLVNLKFGQIYLSLMIDGMGSKPFSAKTLPPISHTSKNYSEEVIANSRAVFASTREKVDEMIKQWHAPSEGSGGGAGGGSSQGPRSGGFSGDRERRPGPRPGAFSGPSRGPGGGSSGGYGGGSGGGQARSYPPRPYSGSGGGAGAPRTGGGYGGGGPSAPRPSSSTPVAPSSSPQPSAPAPQVSRAPEPAKASPPATPSVPDLGGTVSLSDLKKKSDGGGMSALKAALEKAQGEAAERKELEKKGVQTFKDILPGKESFGDAPQTSSGEYVEKFSGESFGDASYTDESEPFRRVGDDPNGEAEDEKSASREPAHLPNRELRNVLSVRPQEVRDRRPPVLTKPLPPKNVPHSNPPHTAPNQPLK